MGSAIVPSQIMQARPLAPSVASAGSPSESDSELAAEPELALLTEALLSSRAAAPDDTIVGSITAEETKWEGCGLMLSRTTRSGGI